MPIQKANAGVKAVCPLAYVLVKFWTNLSPTASAFSIEILSAYYYPSEIISSNVLS